MNSLRLNDGLVEVRQRGSSRTPARCAAASSAPRRRRRPGRWAPRASRPAPALRASICAASSARAAAASAGSWLRNTRPGGEQRRELDARLLRDGAQEFLRASSAAGRSRRRSCRPRRSAPRCVRRFSEVMAVSHQPVARLVVEVGDQAKPAAVAFVGVLVESAGLERACVGLALIFSGRQRRCRRRQVSRRLQPSRQFMRSGDPQDLAGPRMSSRGPGGGQGCLGLPGRLSYTITMIR